MNKILIFCIGLLINFTTIAMQQNPLITSLDKLNNSLITLRKMLNPFQPPTLQQQPPLQSKLSGQEKIELENLLTKSNTLIEGFITKIEDFLQSIRSLSSNNIHSRIDNVKKSLKKLLKNPIFSNIELFEDYKDKVNQEQKNSITAIFNILEETINNLKQEIASKLANNKLWKNASFYGDGYDSYYARYKDLLITKPSKRFDDIQELLNNAKEDLNQPSNIPQSNLDKNFLKDFKTAQRTLDKVKKQISKFMNELKTFGTIAEKDKAKQRDFQKLSDSFANIQVINFINRQNQKIETPLALAIKKLDSYKNKNNPNIKDMVKALLADLQKQVQELNQLITDTLKAPWQIKQLKGDLHKLPIKQLYDLTFSPFEDDLKEIDEFINQQKQLWNL